MEKKPANPYFSISVGKEKKYMNVVITSDEEATGNADTAAVSNIGNADSATDSHTGSADAAGSNIGSENAADSNIVVLNSSVAGRASTGCTVERANSAGPTGWAIRLKRNAPKRSARLPPKNFPKKTLKISKAANHVSDNAA